MVHQTTNLNGSSRSAEGPLRGAVSGLGAVVETSIDLAGLQLRLAKSDAQDAAQQVKPVMFVAVPAFGMILSSMPVLGLGISSLRSVVAPLSLWQSQLIVGGAFLLMSAMLLSYCWSVLRRLGAAFDRSQREAQHNLRWLRHAIGQISR